MNNPANKTPDEVVAEKIVSRFVEAGLIPKQYQAHALTKLAQGRLSAEDWRLLAEKALELESREEYHEPQTAH